jgi:hypothetical protein
MFIITTVLERLQTTKCSGFFGNICILFTVRSAAPKDLYVPVHSVVFKLQTFTVPSEEALNKILNNLVCMKIIHVKLKILSIFVTLVKFVFKRILQAQYHTCIEDAVRDKN